MFQHTLAQFPDLIVSSAGVSVGAADYVRTSLLTNSAKFGFWRINLRPGKPLAFGMIQGDSVFWITGQSCIGNGDLYGLSPPCSNEISR